MTDARFDALLFDFDGVILESVDIKTAAFVALYAEHGPAIVERVCAYHLAHGGLSRYEKFRYIETALLGRLPLTTAREQALGARFAALVVEAVLAAPMVAGAARVLAHYRARVPLYVISGTPQDELRHIVAERGLADNFVEVRGSPMAKAPHIAAILAARAYRPARVLMIGDAVTDYEAALATGTRFLGRVAPGTDNPFPADVAIVADFCASADGSLDAFLPA